MAGLALYPRYGPFGDGEGPFGGGDGGGGGSSSSGGSDEPGFTAFPGFAGAALARAVRYRTVHGILAGLAFVLLFPAGAVLVRTVPGRLAVWVHALVQALALAVFVAAAALGIVLVKTVSLPFSGGSLLTNPRFHAHPILGLVLLGMLALQPLLGAAHHVRFRQLGRRTVWSHLHLWNGRVALTAGIVNGGLGLHLARAGTPLLAAYAVVAGIVWLVWLAVATAGELQRGRRSKAASGNDGGGGGGSGGGSGGNDRPRD